MRDFLVKAFLLAAGKGTRLRPLTNKIPKCLVLIRGRPLLHYWLRLCQRYGNGLVVDLGFDVFPGLVGKMYGYLIKEYLLDIGTWKNYKKAQKEWPKEVDLSLLRHHI